jgi:hypothetical protein
MDGVWIGNLTYLTLTTSNCIIKIVTVTVLHTSQITIRHTRSPQSIIVLISRCLVAAFNPGHSPYSLILNYPQPQLPASHRSQLKPIQQKDKAIPVTGSGGLWGCGMLRVPHFLDNRLTDGGEVVSLAGQPRSTPQKHYFSASVTHFC